MHKNNVKNILLGVDYLHSFTYVHYVEQQVGNLPYRYLKPFCAAYIDNYGVTTQREYEMLVRDLDLDVQITINPIGEQLEAQGVSHKSDFYGISVISLHMGDAFPIIKEDILTNKSRKICTYIGQEE